ncbi:MAG: hypothetical protein H0U49_01885 [Parachlamydiaceae bacterium]|nr:hypothetical protein [Parachlamydiaceae bacterium]
MELNQFRIFDLTNIDSQGKIISIFTDELKKTNVDKLQCALDLFGQLFQCISFNLNNLINLWRLTLNQKKQFVSYLLYALYYYEIPLRALATIKNNQETEHFLYTMAVESLDQEKLRTILNGLTGSKQLQIAVYCSIQTNEGTSKIFNNLAFLNEQDQEWKGFSKLLRTKFYNAHYLQKLISENPLQLTLSQSLIDKLEKYAEAQIVEIQQLLPLLIDSIINSPIAFYEILKINPQMDKDKIFNDSQRAYEKLKTMFTPYCNQTYSIDELTVFFKNFGLKGHILNNALINNDSASMALVTQLKSLLEQFQKPWDIPEIENRQFILFVLSICQQLYSFHRTQPSPYIRGLQSLVFALSTRGNKLDEMPWLQSVLEGIDCVKEHLQGGNVQEAPFKLNPIVIFDQAKLKEFKKNDSTIRELSQKYNIEIWHLSNKQTLQLAKKLGIETWIQYSPGELVRPTNPESLQVGSKTSSDQNFGYGGARNCALLLAPMIAGSFQKGISSLEELLKLNKKKLKDIYDNSTLGKEDQDLFIHLGEDDVAIQPCNIFSDALFAESCNDMYFNRSIECSGRSTHQMFAFLDLKNVMEMPTLSFNPWSYKIFRGSMKGMLTKPKFCLPSPMGNEELNVKLPNESLIHFLQPNIHLAGTRFPQKDLPESPWDGLLESLSQQVPYRFLISMTAMFTDSTNRLERSIFPWNDDPVRNRYRFHSLFDLWTYAESKEIKEELKRRFWDNVEFAFRDENSHLLFRRCISGLTDVNFDVDAPQAILDYFKSMQVETQMFVALAKTLTEERLKGCPGFVADSIKKFENQFNRHPSQTILSKGLITLIDIIENFGKFTLDVQR